MNLRNTFFRYVAAAAAAAVFISAAPLQTSAATAVPKAKIVAALQGTTVMDPPLRVDINGDGIPDYIFPRVQHGAPANYSSAGQAALMEGGAIGGLAAGLVGEFGATSSKNFSRAEAFSGKDGKELWQFKAGAQILFVHFDRAHQRLILAGRDGQVHAVDIRTGKASWTALAEHGNIVGMIVAGGKIFAASSSNFLCCLREKNGTVLWRHPFDASIKTKGSWRYLRLSDGVLCAAAIDNRLLGFDPQTGKQLWAAGLPAESSLVGRDPGRVFTYGGHELSAFSLSTGKRLWQVGAHLWFNQYFKVSGHRLYYLRHHSGKLWVECVDPASGKKLWAKPGVHFSSWTSSVYAPKGLALDQGFVDVWAYRQMARLNAKTGRLLWQKKFHGVITGNPVTAEQLLLVPTWGRLQALNARNGKTVWKRTYPKKTSLVVAAGPEDRRCCAISRALMSRLQIVDISNGKLLAQTTCTGATQPLWLKDGDVMAAGLTTYVFSIPRARS